MKKVTIVFTDEQIKIIDKLPTGSSRAEKIRNVVINWLIEKSLITTSAKLRIEREENLEKEGLLDRIKELKEQ